MLTRVLLIAMFVVVSNRFAVSAGTSVEFTLDHAGAVVVPVSINGGDAVPFLLDTGSSHSVISSVLTERLRLPAVAKTTVLTSSGRELRAVVRIRSASIGLATSEDLLASVVPVARLTAIAHGIDGIIGQDFLFAFNYTLDYRSRRLTWSAEAETDDTTHLPLIEQGGRCLIAVPAPRGERPLLLVPDSGSSDLVAFERHGRTRFNLNPANGSSEIVSIAGRQRVRTMMLRELRLGTLTLRNQPIAVVEREGADALEGDGLLPLHLFASVSFNVREGYLVLRRK